MEASRVIIPHSGLGTGKYQAFFKLSEPATSLSHTVGLELPCVASRQSLQACNVTIPRSGLRTGGEIKLKPFLATLESPSHTVGSEQRYLAWEVGTGKTISPSHAVGLELSQGGIHVRSGASFHSEVIIPHSGLGASNSYWNYGRTYTSPSHTVGLVGSELRPEPAYSPEEYVSPSHTVGSEP
jgi:hypothetical protein